MQCERAQEFFSDYLERTLDRPMTVAVEAHLAGCSGCREEIEALQATFYSLEAAPMVQPPADGLWQVQTRLANLRADEYELQRHRQQSGGLLGWLRGLNPMRAAMGAGLATLIVGGGLVATNLGTQNSIIRFPGPTRQAVVNPAATPALDISYGQVSAAGTQIDLKVTPGSEIKDAKVTATVASLNRDFAISGPSGPRRPLIGTLTLPAGSQAEVLKVAVSSDSEHRQWGYLVLTPLAQPQFSTVTQAFYDQPVGEALRRLAPALDAPVVVDADPANLVSLQMTNMKPEAALQELARQIRATLHREKGVYHLTPGS